MTSSSMEISIRDPRAQNGKEASAEGPRSYLAAEMFPDNDQEIQRHLGKASRARDNSDNKLKTPIRTLSDLTLAQAYQ